ncbi:MAG: polymer-forming cytoskeletal protein [Candidatus Hydrogenedentes bacterium]|nr:polymer-forming cytoskeletal protein [Candidatus Hydrogenedentota bacterium]
MTDTARRKPLALDVDVPAASSKDDSYADLDKAAKGDSFLHRISSSFQDMIQTSRGNERPQPSELDVSDASLASADDIAIRRAKNVTPKRMIVPEGVIIGGAMTSGSETEICGRVDGDVVVDGKLYLGQTALISGNVRATSCRVEGLVEGKLECSQEVDVGKTGRLNADALAGKRIVIAGQIFGNVSTAGLLRLGATGRVEGNIQAKQLVIEEGSTFNGRCVMRTPAQRTEK